MLMLMMIGRSTGSIHLKLSKSLSRCPTRLSSSTNNNLQVGALIHGYKLEQVEDIKELNIKPYYFRHQATGAEHLHIHRDGDSNNLFNVSLRTTPTNSTGVAHILEHLALCGSEKFKVRDPFFRMTTRSLATFMNAMTGSDFTTYPFSTQNSKDFENLLRVYVDAVFFPRLRPSDFRQEGWRIEHEKPDVKTTPIVIKGVVYNEMKGVFSSTSAMYQRQILNKLFPDTTYQYESGGDPFNITDLSHQELKRFHKAHYHPSNAKFFTYGDMPVDGHLKLINELVLSRFSENPETRQSSLVTEQETWKSPKTVDVSCPFDQLSAIPEKQTTTSFSYILPNLITDFDTMFSLQILSTLLIDGPNAPFHKSLIESGLGSDFSPSTGLGNFTKQPYFSIGLQNILEGDIPKVHSLIEKTFIEAADKGFQQERLDAVLHDIELGLKHISGNFGFRLLMTIESPWNHEGDVIDFLRVNKYAEKFKNDLKNDKQYWSKLITKNFLSNPHKLIMNMKPDMDFEKKRAEREATILKSKIANLSEVDRQTVLYEGMELMKIQNTRHDSSVLPCLEPSKDIPRELKLKTELKFDSHKGINIQMCELPTNDVVYFKAISNIGDKLQAANLIDYLPLFCDVAARLGAGAYNRHELAQKIQLKTGGLGLSLLINSSLSTLDEFKLEILFGSHALRRNVDGMFDLWTNVIKQIHFQDNIEYLSQMIKVAATDLAEGIPFSGHAYAMKRSSMNLSNLSSIDERLSGLSHIARMKDIASKETPESVAGKLSTIATMVLNPSTLKFAINAESIAIQSVNDRLKKFIDDINKNYTPINKADVSNDVNDYESTKVEDLKFTFPSHHVAKALVTVPRLHEDFPKLNIMSKLISAKYLLREVREKGGAYGTGLRVSNSGMMHFFSRHDPNTLSTLKIFDSAADWIAEGTEYTDEDIEECKLGVFQDIDQPVDPGRRGLRFFTIGETDDMRRQYRIDLLNVTKEDVRNVASKYLYQDEVGTYII